MSNTKLCVLIPAYNCAGTIAEVCRRVALPCDNDEIIVVDDHSADNTFEVAQAQPRVFVHRNPVNLGYGGTSHRLYELALERGADLTVNTHGDIGHHPEDIPLLLKAFQDGNPDIVVGSRLLYLLNNAKRLGWFQMFTQDSARVGMPLSRFIGHCVLTNFQNLVYGSHLHSFHEGMRACNRSALEWAVSTNFPKWYSYDNELLYQAHKRKLIIHEVPVPPSYDPRAKSASPSIKYGMSILRQILHVMFTGK